jgi:hypothetical protein
MTIATTEKAVWSVPVAVDAIPDRGLHLEIEAPADVLATIAKIAGLRELTRFTAVFDLTKEGSRVHICGRIDASVGQTCIATLEPVQNEVDETVDLVFAPSGSAPSASKEPPEPLIGGAVDLGAVATEFLMLGIDPYPRKAGATFVAPRQGDDGAHPFAALAALKTPSGNKKSRD